LHEKPTVPPSWRGFCHPYPFNFCYCSICRKTAGGGGYAINLGAANSTLQVDGQENVAVYRAEIRDQDSGVMRESPARRNFCRICGSALWVWDPRWPGLIHPFASAIDSSLPVPPQHTHLMVGSKAFGESRHSRFSGSVAPRLRTLVVARLHSLFAREFTRMVGFAKSIELVGNCEYWVTQ